MRETTHRPRIETDDMDFASLGTFGMFLIQTAGLLAIFGLIIILIDRLAK
jgi:hypothetical protein